MENEQLTQKIKMRLKFLTQKHFHLSFIIIFLLLFINSKEQLEINLVINGNATQNLIYEDFYLDPSEVFINGELNSSCKKSCYFENDISKVTIKFDRKIESCYQMFESITSIKEIDLSQLDFSLVKNMELMFHNCYNIEKINFGKINTSLVDNMSGLFYKCSSLKSIDVTNFDTSSVTNMNSMFKLCESLTSLDVSNFNTSKIEDMYDLFGYCYNLNSIDVSNFDTSRVTNMQGMFYECYCLKYLDLSNFNTSSLKKMNSMFANTVSLFYINLNSFRIKNDTEILEAFVGTNPDLKVCINDSETTNILMSQIKNLDCINICFEENIKISLNENKCFKSCNESQFKYEYKNYCYEKCPINSFIKDNDEYICIDKNNDDSYYLDNNTGMYKECYKSCKKCNERGNEINNNCFECKDDFIFLNDSKDDRNCYEECNYFYYIDEYDNYNCTKERICPDKFNKLIKAKNKCIDKCENDNIFKYEFNNTCYEHCPNGTNQSNNICFYKEIIEEDRYINIFKEYISNNDIIKNVTESKNDYVKKINDVIYQITTTENQKINKENNKNISTIDLENCENILRKKYNISETLPLTLLKIDYISPYTLIPIVNYEIYHPLNKTKLNLSYCKNIELNIPVVIDEKEEFKYDPKSEFYNDICFSYTTDNGTDIILNDRKEEFKHNNLSLCENNCEFIKYDKSNKQSSCVCPIKNGIEPISEIIQNPNKLSNNFSLDEIDSNLISSNSETMKCTNTLFSKEGIISNISSYIILLIILQFLLSILLFIKCGCSSIEGLTSEVLDSRNIEIKERKSHIIKGNKPVNEDLDKKIKYYPPKRNKENDFNLKLIKSNNSKTSNYRESFFSLKTKKTKKRKTHNLSGIDIIPDKIKNNSYVDYELNTLIYEKAILVDKRTFGKYYFSLLKIKHPIIFGFCPIKDYNLSIIKMCIFSLSFSIYYTINLEFFNLKIIHKLYEEGGKYDIVYFLPKILLAFVISHFICVIIKYIFLSERNIIQIKMQQTFAKANNIASKITRIILLKCIIFFILGVSFLIFFWMLLSSFGAVYKNTQIIVFENTLISFGISLIYPFIINIFPGILRVCSIGCKLKCMYNLSKCFQLL